MKEKNPGLSGASILTCGANAQRAGYAALPGPIPLSVSRHCRGARDSRSTGLKPVSARSGARSKCLTTRTGQDSSRNACAIPWTEPFACCSEQRPAQLRREHCARRSPCSLPLILAFRCPRFVPLSHGVRSSRCSNNLRHPRLRGCNPIPHIPPLRPLFVVPAKAGIQGFQSLAPGSPLTRGRRIVCP